VSLPNEADSIRQWWERRNRLEAASQAVAVGLEQAFVRLHGSLGPAQSVPPTAELAPQIGDASITKTAGGNIAVSVLPGDQPMSIIPSTHTVQAYQHPIPVNPTPTPSDQAEVDAEVEAARSDPALHLSPPPAASERQQIKWALQRLGKTADAIADTLTRRGVTGLKGVTGRDPIAQLLQARFGVGTWYAPDAQRIVRVNGTGETDIIPSDALIAFEVAFQDGKYPGLVALLPEGDAGLSC
jgi:hypothetical protein